MQDSAAEQDTEQPAWAFCVGQPGERGIGGVGTAACGKAFVPQPVEGRERHTIFLVIQEQLSRLGGVDAQQQVSLGGTALAQRLLCAVAGVQRPDEDAFVVAVHLDLSLCHGLHLLPLNHITQPPAKLSRN